MSAYHGMKDLIKALSQNPLIPGSLLAVMSGTPEKRSVRPFDYSALVDFNTKTTAEVLTQLRKIDFLTAAQASRILALDAQFVGYYHELTGNVAEIAEVTGCDSQSIHRLARALFSARLFSEYLEIVTVPHLSYETTTEGAVDLVANLRGIFRQLVGSAWAVFFPGHQFGLITHASAQFWVACLDGPLPDQMCKSFVGVFRRQHKERLQTLNHEYDYEKGIRLKDAIVEHLSGAKDREKRLRETIDPDSKRGVDGIFRDLLHAAGKLQLPPPVAIYYEFLVLEICEAFCSMNGKFSARNLRFIDYISRQLANICHDFHALDPNCEKVEEVLQEFERLVGVSCVKKCANDLANFARIQQMRRAKGLRPVATSYHMTYAGNAGTGKTTVAGLMVRLYRSLNILKKGNLVECDRSMLLAESEVHTVIRTNAVIDRAIDGVLLVNDAPALTMEPYGFGQEVLETLLRRMEENPDRLVVLLAGLSDQMADFLQSNPRLQSHFSKKIEFPDYTAKELSQIFAVICQRENLSLSPALLERTTRYFEHLEHTSGDNSCNAQLVRHCFDAVVEAQANRLAGSEDLEAENLNRLEAEDLLFPVEDFAIDHRPAVNGHSIQCEHCDEVIIKPQWPSRGDSRCPKCGRVQVREVTVVES